MLTELINRYPGLAACKAEIEAARALMITCFERGGKLLICGNGGSAADADHISGELLKGFLLKRPLSLGKAVFFSFFGKMWIKKQNFFIFVLDKFCPSFYNITVIVI